MPPPHPLRTVLSAIVGGGLLGLAGVGVSVATAGEIYAHGSLALHGGPDDGFAPAGTIGAGTKINVLWCNGAATWCLVQHDRTQGWAPIASLKAADVAKSVAGGDRAGASASAGLPRAAAEATSNLGSGTSNGMSSGGIGVSVSTPAASVSVKLP